MLRAHGNKQLACIFAFCSFAAYAQEFEVAEIHRSQPGAKPDFNLQNGRVKIQGVPLKILVTTAWSAEDDMISGAPAWLASDTFDLVAKSAPDTTDANLKLMLRALLADRFKLAVHMEEKVVPVYALSIGKRGPRLVETTSKDPDGQCKRNVVDGIRTFTCTNMSMADLADWLPDNAKAYLDHPVVDLTGLTGHYDFTLQWTGRGVLNGTATPGAVPAGGLTVFDALNKQLGLDLAPKKHPLPLVVIDHIERIPTAN